MEGSIFEKMKKFFKERKKIILCLFLWVLAGILWVVVYFCFLKVPTRAYPSIYPDPKNVHYPLTKERCQAVADPVQREKCFEDLKKLTAIWEKDKKACLSLKEEKERWDCIYKIAKFTLDEKDCFLIEDEKIKDSCIMEVAVDKLDEKVCDYFSKHPFEKRECQDKVKAFRIIRKERKIEKCQEVKTLEYSTLCFRYFVTRVIQDCSKLKGEQKLLCQSIIYKVRAQTVEDCKKIPLENYRKVCEITKKTGKSGLEIDSDNDGKSDEGELFYNLDPFDPDTDDDGLLDGEEIKLGTDPLSPDTDGDGVNDKEEIERGTDPDMIDN